MAPSVTPLSTHYALVIDAGSSGSRLQIYSWRDPDLERAEILQEVQDARRGRGGKKWWWSDVKDVWKGKGKAKDVELEMEKRALRRLVRVGKGVEGDAWVKRVEPGISSMSPDDIPAYLAPLLQHALQQIPPSQHHRTPIYLYATAGMRLLSDEARDAILSATCTTIRNEYPFSVAGPSEAGPCGENIRVITGEEEGLWGWVAVNYLMDGFGHAPDPSTSISAASSASSGLLPLAPLAEPPPDSSHESVTPVDVNHHSPTFGFLDMGGASTQLAFSPSAAELHRSGFPKDDLREVSLRLLSGEEVEWPVFVASWLGFGTNRVRDRYAEVLVDRWRALGGSIADLETPISDPCLPIDLVIPSTDPESHPGFKGTGSFASCLQDLRPLLDHHAPCPTDHCLFAGLPTPHIDFEREDQRGFIGISEYWYTAQQVLGLGGVWDWGEWEKGMSDFCGRQWSSIEDQVEEEKGWLGAEVELSRLQMQCFKGAWVSNVLHEGIGVPRLVDQGGNDTLTGGDLGNTNLEAERRAREKGLLSSQKKAHFQSMDEVGSTAISWTLGKMVIEASKAVRPYPQRWTLPQNLGLGRLENKLDSMGIQAIWAYGFMVFAMAALFFSFFRRKLRISPCSPSRRRGRKPSISGDPIPSPVSTGHWQWPSIFGSSTRSEWSLEDGNEQPSMTKNNRLIGRLRIWSPRIGNAVRRNIPYGPHRRASLPTPVSMASYRAAPYVPQPPSPLLGTPFFPATNGLSVPSSRPPSVSPGISSSSVSPAASPPRTKSWPAKQRQNSSTMLSSSAVQLLEGTSRNGTGGGWNDPPMGMFDPHTPPTGLDRDRERGVLTPAAGSFSSGLAQLGGHDTFPTLSRNSSRLNLNDMGGGAGGLAQRSTSRAATPMEFEETP